MYYTKELVLHSVVHLDEKTPHIHCVVVPLVKKFDNRTNTERYTITKKEYIKDNTYHNYKICIIKASRKRLLLRKGGIKGSDYQNIKIKEYNN